jgi:hypothetical protein
MLFGTLALLLALLVVLIPFAIYESATAPPEPVIVNPRLWHDANARDRIEFNGYTFEMPLEGVYSRLDASYGPDLEGVLLIREKPSRSSELVVGRISRLTTDTMIDRTRFGGKFLEFVEETKSRGDDARLLTFQVKGRDPERPHVLGLFLRADAYLWSDGITFKVEHMTKIMGSWAPIETE